MLAPEYSLCIQAQLIPALAVLHNLIQIHDPSDIPTEDDNTYTNNENGLQDNGVNDTGAGFQEEITLRMWEDYQDSRHRRA